MPYCPSCGVEIGGQKNCPLCGTANPSLEPSIGNPAPAGCAEEDGGGAAFLGETARSVHLTPDEGRKIAWEVLTVAFAIAVAILLSINLLVGSRPSWSLYPVSSFVFVWICGTALLALPKKRTLGFALVGTALPLFLAALGLITQDVTWALRLAIPIAIFSELNAAMVGLGIGMLKRKGLNVLALAFAGVALECLGLEIFIDLFLDGKIRLGWSAITAMALVPISAFLLYLHVRVVKTTNLRRLFKL